MSTETDSVLVFDSVSELLQARKGQPKDKCVMTEISDTDELRTKTNKNKDVCLPCINMKLDAIKVH